MYLDLPVFRRCCCCLPVRHGIIAFGYFHMVIACLMISLESWLLTKGYDASKPAPTVFNGVGFMVQVWVVFVLYAVDIVFTVVLLVGAHRKNTRLMRVFFYYSVTTLAASFLLFLITRGNVHESLLYIHIAEMFFAVFCFGLQIFILLLVRSEIKKLKENTGHRFVNHAAEVCVDIPTGNGHNPF
ncbi:uncharacterized protein LOC121734864 isoform X3 [Aricia agestis]|uniref:uncharacterized protein LOC121734864 isoform X3 n=1 Tax=Aricia agestis TaxID=91739 RepID=UPI001C202BF0|nr:uncharacterized protein LOC121734864 isoform X3 [Aricia agestis]